MTISPPPPPPPSPSSSDPNAQAKHDAKAAHRRSRIAADEGGAGPYPFPAVTSDAPPDGPARERFERRRAAGRMAELIAQAIGRGCTEAGTARIAIKLALESNAMREANRRESGRDAGAGKLNRGRESESAATERSPRGADDEAGRADDSRRAIVIRGRGGELHPSTGG